MGNLFLVAGSLRRIIEKIVILGKVRPKTLAFL